MIETNDPSFVPASESQTRPPLSNKKNAAELLRRLLIDSPLYAKVEGDADLINELDLFTSAKKSLQFDLYCISCDQATPWVVKPILPQNSGGGSGFRYAVQTTPSPVKVVTAVCLRHQHFYTYILHRSESALQKIGQKPSMADIAFGDLKTLGAIEARDRKELGRALGLFSHDTPLGAFVYLRRVFERMIIRAHEYHISEAGSPIENWINLRMGERVSALGDVLPGNVASNAGVFGLLSKGIHELSDEDAETLFPLVKAVIFQMLGDEARHRQEKHERQETSKALQAAITKFNPPTSNGNSLADAAQTKGAELRK